MGDNHDHRERFDATGAARVGADSELETELAQRLRNLPWPKPPPGLKERCLREILARMAEEQEKPPGARGQPAA